MNGPKINLLEQRLRGSGNAWKAEPDKHQQPRRLFPGGSPHPQDSLSGWNFRFNEFNVVEGVHGLANELWKDVQIFGPYQTSESTPTTFTATRNSKQRKSLDESGSNKCSSPISRADKLHSELTDKQKIKLDALATLYSNSLDRNICENLLDEVQLWFQLLSEEYDSQRSSFAPQDQVFGTVSRRSYFVSLVLDLQMISVVGFLDRSLILSLTKSFAHRIPKRIRKTLEDLSSAQQELSSKVEEVLSPISASKTPGNDDRVLFQSETEGRSSFLNSSDFNAFCKQRDIFYAIKDAWTATTNEQPNFTAKPLPQRQLRKDFEGYRASGSASGKGSAYRGTMSSPVHDGNPQFRFKQLFQLNTSPSNLSYLAALCLSQCLLDYAHYKVPALVEDENLRQMFSSNPGKFRQLENRFPGPNHKQQDPLAFFKYFVDSSGSSDLVHHLVDRCVLELNEVENQVTHDSFNDWKDVLPTLTKARRLGKILGYLFFKPYRSCENVRAVNSIDLESYVQLQIRLRGYRQLPINLSEKLQASFSSKRVVSTLPWIVDFLCEADAISFQLPCLSRTLSLLVQLYRGLLVVSSSPQLPFMTKSTIAFLRFYCGKLYSRKTFPSATLFLEEIQLDPNIRQFVSSLTHGIPDMNASILNSPDSDDEHDCLDESEHLASALLYSALEPKSLKLRRELSKQPGSQNSTLTYQQPNVLSAKPKHIRPVVVTDQSAEAYSENEIEQKLERTFFASHSTSLKRTIEFVSERTASNFVKSLKSIICTSIRDELVNKGIVGDLAVSLCQKAVLENFTSLHQRRLEEAVALLLGDDVSSSVLRICQQLCFKKSSERIADWASTHISKDLFPDIPEANRSGSNKAETKEIATSTKNQPKCSFLNLAALHSIHRQVYQKHLLDKRLLEAILLPECIGESAAVQSAAFDLSLATMAFAPSAFTQEAQALFVRYWRSTGRCLNQKIITGKNIVLLQHSQSPDTTWKLLAELVSKFLETGVMTVEQFEQESLAVLRAEWPPDIIARLAVFSKEVLAKNVHGKSASTEVIDWVAWACSDDAGL